MHKPRHRHRFKVSSWSGNEIEFYCRGGSCGERRKRKMDREELRRFKADFKNDSALDVHLVWHDFQRRFKKDNRWIYSGYDFSKRVERWARKWPGNVRIVGCDDSYHAGSDLVLVEHRSEDSYMGTTVVYIPQCTGELPISFFLYPGHRKALINALREIEREAAPRERRERKLRAERHKWWASRPVPKR